MGNEYFDTGTFTGFDQRSATDSVGARVFPSHDIDPVVDDVSVMSHIIHNHLPEKLDAAMKAKRIFDILISAVALVTLSPLLMIAALLIKLESRGPVLFTQERIGMNRRRRDRRLFDREFTGDRRIDGDRRKRIHAGKPFKIYKFRTMVEDAERDVPVLAIENDPRVTRFGRVFRKTRVDEIPQFINVIRGDMSIIGPRPERSFFIDQMRTEVPEFTARLAVKPGITGLAQVENGYTSTLERMKDKLFFDLKYITELSFIGEIKILFKTVFVVFTGKGAC
jgi:lipopolysaccharide/colanic/teichoic acid biosynthesis glycosyltransferase